MRFFHDFPIWWLRFGAKHSIEETGWIETIKFGWFLWRNYRPRSSADERPGPNGEDAGSIPAVVTTMES